MKYAVTNAGRLVWIAGLGAALSLMIVAGFTNAQTMEADAAAGTSDLAIEANAPTHVAPDTVFTVNAAYSNLGDVAAPGARITATLPAGTEFVSATDRWGAPLPPATVDGHTVVWEIGSVSASVCCQHILIAERVVPGVAEGEVLSTTVEIASTAVESDTADNTAVAASTVCDMAGSTKQVSAGEAMPGGALTYTIRLELAQRQGQPNRERTVILTDVLPASHQVRFLGWTGNVTGTRDGQTLQWQGRVRAGQPVMIQYRLGIHGEVTPGTHITNGIHLSWSDGELRLGPVTTVVTLPHYAAMFGPNGGAWRHEYGVTLTVPPGAVTDTTRFEFKPRVTGTQVISGPPGWIHAHRAFEFTAFRFGEPVRQFNQPLTITLRYGDADVTGLKRETLRLWTRTGPGEPWAMLGEPARAMSGTLAFTTTHFTEFALFGRGVYETWLPMTQR